MRIVLSLDLSTKCSGWATFDRDTKKLLKSGRLKSQVSGLHKLRYPKAALFTTLDMAAKIRDLVIEVKPDWIVIEEVNRGVSRLGQKSLDALHFFVLSHLYAIADVSVYLDHTTYVDSNGKKGWRGMLGLKLSDEDKQVNADLRLLNKSRKKSQKAPLIDYKVLAQRYVNAKYKTSFNVWENPGDDDEVDAIALGDAWCAYLDV